MFDHNKPVSKGKGPEGKYLEQDGVKYTNAVYNRFTGKWEPEPQLIEDYQEKKDEVNLDIALKQCVSMLKKISEVIVPLLDVYGREAIARQRAKEESFNRMRGELAQAKKELKKVDKLRKRTKLEEEIEGLKEDGEQN